LAEARALLRRKPVIALLQAMLTRLTRHLEDTIATAAPTEEFRATDPQNACHKDQDHRKLNRAHDQEISVDQLTRAVPDVMHLARSGNQGADDMSDSLTDFLGIDGQTHRTLLERHGKGQALLVLMYLYQRSKEIRAPEQYLRKILATANPDEPMGSPLIRQLLHRRTCQIA